MRTRCELDANSLRTRCEVDFVSVRSQLAVEAKQTFCRFDMDTKSQFAQARLYTGRCLFPGGRILTSTHLGFHQGISSALHLTLANGYPKKPPDPASALTLYLAEEDRDRVTIFRGPLTHEREGRGDGDGEGVSDRGKVFFQFSLLVSYHLGWKAYGGNLVPGSTRWKTVPRATAVSGQ